jgi:hypothetical protein
MPVTAIWFLLLGGVLLVSSLAVAAVRDAERSAQMASWAWVCWSAR